MDRTCDLLIVGAGPAGLSAAVNAASEGLNTTVIEALPYVGGQAMASKAIENYLGFPQGLTGAELFARASEQLDRFGAQILAPAHVMRIAEEGTERDPLVMVTLDDETEIVCRTAALTMGLTLNRLDAKGVGTFLNRGVSYGTPALPDKGQSIVVVGGANSAGQAADYLASHRDAKVTMLVRGDGLDTMSSYLVKRIDANPNIRVMYRANVIEVRGNGHLREVVTKEHGIIEATGMYIYIGGRPKTAWLAGSVKRSERGFILTGGADRLPFETSMRGVFAAGDVREGSVKRVANAVGEGSVLVSQIHEYLKGVSQ